MQEANLPDTFARDRMRLKESVSFKWPMYLSCLHAVCFFVLGWNHLGPKRKGLS